jgi:hypothetical protein
LHTLHFYLKIKGQLRPFNNKGREYFIFEF